MRSRCAADAPIKTEMVGFPSFAATLVPRSATGRVLALQPRVLPTLVSISPANREPVAPAPVFVPPPAKPVSSDATWAALRDISRPLYAVAQGRTTVLTDRPPRTLDGLVGIIPAAPVETLGSAAFRNLHHLRYAYVTGAMAGGIASVDLVVDMAQAGCLGFFGAGALSLPAIEQAIREIQARLFHGESYGVNLLHNYYDENL
jgi:hypothetical protein